MKKYVELKTNVASKNSRKKVLLTPWCDPITHDKGAQLGSLIKPHRYMIKEAVVKATLTLTHAGSLLKPDVCYLLDHFLCFVLIFTV